MYVNSIPELSRRSQSGSKRVKQVKRRFLYRRERIQENKINDNRSKLRTKGKRTKEGVRSTAEFKEGMEYRMREWKK